ncbi:hypothetical protein SCLCIDRAFT_376421 [Scleroderma citrinum Foug A]|uniref:Uncharacterized protein n=1 Tax=Scleroderma citrinum Foug A TaxID=1036808 RepID=A0A0C3D0V3_9AGAM|nr:hypothetical protein SCLCIDRAFT_376421 [Scleroderma citrinum Foug A]
MHSNPRNQQRRAPGGDTESLMEVDEGPINPSTPPRHTCIPDEAIQEASERLGLNVRPDHDDRFIEQSLDVVWVIVRRALSQDPDVRQRLTNFWRNLLENDVFLKQRPVESSQSRWIESEDSVNGMRWLKLLHKSLIVSDRSYHTGMEFGIQRRCCKRAPCDHLQLP